MDEDSQPRRQRIMIATALVLKPVLLIADEPTTTLDATTQAQILKLIRELQDRRGMGVLFITHDFGVVADIADRIVVMQHGRIVEQGPVADILGNPQYAYTQMLIGAVPSMTPPERAPSTGDPALVTHALNKQYRTPGFFGGGRVVHAAQDVKLEARRHETLGIVGESGSGKSTVACWIMRLLDPTSGEVLIAGEDFADMLKVVRGAYVMVGHSGEVALHNPGFVLGKEILTTGAAIMARVAERRLPLG
jgi:peptide/nickel transport system ATP-binding protein